MPGSQVDLVKEWRPIGEPWIGILAQESLHFVLNRSEAVGCDDYVVSCFHKM